jgi:hypothetical protein
MSIETVIKSGFFCTDKDGIVSVPYYRVTENVLFIQAFYPNKIEEKTKPRVGFYHEFLNENRIQLISGIRNHSRYIEPSVFAEKNGGRTVISKGLYVPSYNEFLILDEEGEIFEIPHFQAISRYILRLPEIYSEVVPSEIQEMERRCYSNEIFD